MYNIKIISPQNKNFFVAKQWVAKNNNTEKYQLLISDIKPYSSFSFTDSFMVIFTRWMRILSIAKTVNV